MTNDYGDPVVGLYVVAATADKNGGATRELGRSLTDDRGDYRIGGLAPNQSHGLFLRSRRADDHA